MEKSQCRCCGKSTLKSKTVIAGRNLLSMKNDVIHNMKVALSKAERAS